MQTTQVEDFAVAELQRYIWALNLWFDVEEQGHEKNSFDVEDRAQNVQQTTSQ